MYTYRDYRRPYKFTHDLSCKTISNIYHNDNNEHDKGNRLMQDDPKYILYYEQNMQLLIRRKIQECKIHIKLIKDKNAELTT